MRLPPLFLCSPQLAKNGGSLLTLRRCLQAGWPSDSPVPNPAPGQLQNDRPHQDRNQAKYDDGHQRGYVESAYHRNGPP